MRKPRSETYFQACSISFQVTKHHYGEMCHFKHVQNHDKLSLIAEIKATLGEFLARPAYFYSLKRT